MRPGARSPVCEAALLVAASVPLEVLPETWVGARRGKRDRSLSPCRATRYPSSVKVTAFFRRGGVGPSFGLVAGCLFGEPERFQPRGVHVNSPRPSLVLILAHRTLLEASKLGFPNSENGQVCPGM